MAIKRRTGLLLLAAVVLGGVLAVFVGTGLVHPRSALIPVAGSDHSADVGGHRIRFRLQGGPGPAVVFLHGFGGSLEEWEPVVAQMPGARCFSLDLPGFGGSDRTYTAYSLEDQRRYLLAFMDAQKIDRAILAGRSMGASLALWTAAKSPERVAGVFAMAPSGLPGSLRYKWPISWLYRPGLINRAVDLVIGNEIFGTCFPLSLARQGVGVTASYNDKFAAALDEVVPPVQLAWSTGDERVPFALSLIHI